MTYDALYVNGTNIAVAGVRFIEELGPLYATSPLRGENLVIPGRAGEVVVPKVIGARTMPLGMVITAADPATGIEAADPAVSSKQARENYRTLLRLLNPGGTVTLKRTIGYPAGDESHTCLAEFLSAVDPTYDLGSDDFARAVIDFRLLDGVWYKETAVVHTLTGSSSVTILGDVTTRRMTIAFSGATGAQALTNSTTGEAVTLAALDPAAHAAVLDVEDFTAVRNSVNVVSKVSSTGSDYSWMTLAPGNNTLVVTGGGTVTLSYFPAYL